MALLKPQLRAAFISSHQPELIFKSLSDHLKKTFNLKMSYSKYGAVINALNTLERQDFIFIYIHESFFFGDNFFQTTDISQDINFIEAQLGKRLKKYRENIFINIFSLNKSEALSGPVLAKLMKIEYLVNNFLVKLSEENSNLVLVDASCCIDDLDLGFGSFMRDQQFGTPLNRSQSNELGERYQYAMALKLMPSAKVIAVDGDDTLWGGILGEDGWRKIRCSQSDNGDLFFRFQKFLLALKELGYVLVLVSKNHLKNVEELFEKRCMPLKISDFVNIYVNYNPKADNLMECADNLNLGLDSFIFIDNSLHEINEMSERIPEIRSVLFSKEKFDFTLNYYSEVAFLLNKEVTDEDSKKTRLYQENFHREVERRNWLSHEAYLSSLETEVRRVKNDDASLRRVAQMSLKINQFNLGGTRYSKDDLVNDENGSAVYAFKVVDRFGEVGIVCAAIVDDGCITDFWLSCRAFGRGIETAALSYIISDIANNGYPSVRAVANHSNRNTEFIKFYEMNGFRPLESEPGNLWVLEIQHFCDLKVPSYLNLVGSD